MDWFYLERNNVMNPKWIYIRILRHMEFFDQCPDPTNKIQCELTKWKTNRMTVLQKTRTRIKLIHFRVALLNQFMFSLFFTFILPFISITVYGIICILKEQSDCILVFPNICMIPSSNVIYIIPYRKHHSISFTTCTTLLSIPSYTTTTLQHQLSDDPCFLSAIIFFIQFVSKVTAWSSNGPLTCYVKLLVAHAPGMPGTASPPPTSKETAS